MTRICAVIFDLDNVLYNEQNYTYLAFRSIAHFLSGHCSLSETEIYSKLVCDFEKKGSMYPRLFNDVIKDLSLEQDLVPEILKIYASLDTKIELFPSVASLLLELRGSGLKLALVTNGNSEIQRNKVRLLDAEKFFDAVVYARETDGGKEKPDPAAYALALQKLCVKAQETVCVGDNPYTDFWGAKQLGMRTVRVLFGEFKDVHLNEEYEAELSIHSLVEFPEIIDQFNR
jgi:putative hydrolase of the HAD superfamily